jgi:hypothetical protein
VWDFYVCIEEKFESGGVTTMKVFVGYKLNKLA